ncbi:hypothetical protein NL676_001182 [Syzygium grande]|nr:hypothetical protein NL676_001182 [Syzygium grande]
MFAILRCRGPCVVASPHVCYPKMPGALRCRKPEHRAKPLHPLSPRAWARDVVSTSPIPYSASPALEIPDLVSSKAGDAIGDLRRV